MASQEELLQSIHPDMKLNKAFFLRIYGYSITDPKFKDAALNRLVETGCSKAPRYYDDIVSEYEKGCVDTGKEVGDWYARYYLNNKKEGGQNWKTKQDLQKKSDRELLTLLQELKQDGQI